MEFITPYKLTILVLGLTGLLFCIQLAIADIVSIKAKHTPGFSVQECHSSFIFRAHRAFANSNETLGILVLFTLFAIFSSANPSWLNIGAICYFVGRIAHMLTYYFDLKLLRSIAFGVVFIGLIMMFITGLLTWL